MERAEKSKKHRSSGGGTIYIYMHATPPRVIHPLREGKGVLDRMVSLTGHGAASGINESKLI